MSWPGAIQRTTLSILTGAVLSVAMGVSPPVAAGQEIPSIAHEVFVGSELEHYLRVLQVGGVSPRNPWTVRPFSIQEVSRLDPTDSDHPWRHRYSFAAEPATEPMVRLVQPRTRLVYNSGFPYGGNDGPMWAGRGLTTAAQLGVTARYGPVSLVLAPLAFRAENRPFELMRNGLPRELRFADGRAPGEIDLPQRFGDGAYMRMDPGESKLTLDLPHATMGLSTASQQWGPARDHPILLGNNAGGYLHAFVGTSAPADLWIARVHGRIVWGRLEQSEFTDIPAEESRRFASGMVISVLPRWPDGLELGLGRFYHILWRPGGPSLAELTRPFEAFLKASRGPQQGGSDPFSTADNQLAAVFARWHLPDSGFEIYGEYGRNDHNWDLRDFLLEPDHDSSYLLGFQKVWGDGQRFVVARGELLNARVSHLARVRPQVPFYRHHIRRQGHTHRGQVLGSPAAFGGAASTLAAELYHPGGRWTVEWERAVRRERGVDRGADVLDPRAIDVVHSAGVEGLFFVGRLDLTAGIQGAYNFNRNFASDRFNLNVAIGARIAVER